MRLMLMALTACTGTLQVTDEPEPSDIPTVPTEPEVPLPGYPTGISFDVFLYEGIDDLPDRLTIGIFNGNSLYDYGFARTGVANGFREEDCLTFQCHPVGRNGAILTGTTQDVLLGSTTRFSYLNGWSTTAELTHIVRDQVQPEFCWVWGHDPSYYDSANCELFER